MQQKRIRNQGVCRPFTKAAGSFFFKITYNITPFLFHGGCMLSPCNLEPILLRNIRRGGKSQPREIEKQAVRHRK